MIVQSKLNPAPDLYIIHSKQLMPNQTLWQLPFKNNFSILNSTNYFYLFFVRCQPLSEKFVSLKFDFCLNMILISSYVHIMQTSLVSKEKIYNSNQYNHYDSNRYSRYSLLTITNQNDNTIIVLTADKNGVFSRRNIYDT